MPLNLWRPKMCGVKRRHRSWIQAESHIGQLLKRDLVDDGEMTIYRCLFCGFYHVGHRKATDEVQANK